MEFPLYDVPYLVRDPNEYQMSANRHAIELQNQAVVDDYFIARDRGASWHEARKMVAEKHQLSTRKVQAILVWFCKEAKKSGKYDFLEKFSPEKEHIC